MSDTHDKPSMQRRNLLKALAGIPILGLFGNQLFRNMVYEKSSYIDWPKELGLNFNTSGKSKIPISSNKDIIRIGIVGWGTRAISLGYALGYMHPEALNERIKNGQHLDWLKQANLNIAITGICDVFDERAEHGLTTVKSNLHPDGYISTGLKVKRFKHYHDMLNSPDIDAVIIATPEHHHAQMVIEAAHAGKNIYCEKSFTRTEQEIYDAYDAVKNSNIVFQLGHQISQSPIFHKAKEIINKNILGDISLVETTTNRNTASGAWIRHLDKDGNPKHGNIKSIDWQQWLGSRPKVPFSVDRYYNWTKWFDYSTGLLGQLFTHEFDAVNQLLQMGIPKTVTASGGIYFWKDNRDIPDSLNVSFEYPDNNFTMLYSASLGNSRSRGRVFMGRDASMELGSTIKLAIDKNSKRFKKQIDTGKIIPGEFLESFDFGQEIDAISSATTKYYTSRGLTTAKIDGISVDLTHLHIKEWIDTIRNGGETSANIERSFEEGVAVQMAHKAYIEKRQVRWDPIKRRIV